jgi:hypothetical protein
MTVESVDNTRLTASRPALPLFSAGLGYPNLPQTTHITRGTVALLREAPLFPSPHIVRMGGILFEYCSREGYCSNPTSSTRLLLIERFDQRFDAIFLKVHASLLRLPDRSGGKVSIHLDGEEKGGESVRTILDTGLVRSEIS